MHTSLLIPGRLSWLLLHLIRLVAGAILIWSGISKIQRSYDFLSDVYHYELVGPKLGLAVAVVLPWLEVIVGVCLLAGIMVAGAFLMAAFLAGMFAFANAYAIHRGLSINCGCFGGENDRVGYATLLRAAVLGLIAVIGYVLLRRNTMPADSISERGQEIAVRGLTAARSR